MSILSKRLLKPNFETIARGVIEIIIDRLILILVLLLLLVLNR